MSNFKNHFVFIFSMWLLTGAAAMLFGQSGVFDRAGIIRGHGVYSSLPEESVDLFIGNLTLRYRDIFIPGPNGLNIEIWRVYNSKILYDRPSSQQNPTVQAYPKSMLGLGWTMHMGLVHNAYSSTPEIEFPDGRREKAFPPKSSEYDWGPNYRITRDFLKYYCQTGYYPKLYFQNGVVWTFGNIASLPLANGSSETVYMVTRIEDPLGNSIEIEYDAQDSLRSISKITDSMGREVRFIKSYPGGDPAKLAEIWIKNADESDDVIYSYSVGSFPGSGFYKLTSFTPPEFVTPSTYEYNDGSAYNYELTKVTTSFGGVLEYSYNGQSFYFNTTQLISRVVSQKRITFNAGEQAKVWDYAYPTYQGASTGTTTVTGPEYSVSATHYGYESTSANRWRIGLQTANAAGDGSGSSTTAWTYHEISTTPWYVLGVNMGTAKGPLVSVVTESRTGDSALATYFFYLRTGVKRYGLPTKLSYLVNGAPSAKSSKELAYFYEAHSSFLGRYMLSFVANQKDKTAAGDVVKETMASYFEENGKWGALKQIKRWKTGTTYLTWDYTYNRDALSPEYYSITVDGPGSSGISTMSYKYGLEQSVSAPDYLRYTRHIYKYGFVLHEWNQYGGSRSYGYDGLGRTTTVEWRHAWVEPEPPEPPDPPDPFLTMSYDWQDGENRVVITRGGNTIIRHWDGFGRDLGYTETGDGTTLYYLRQLDAEGRIKKETRGSAVFDPGWEDYVYSYQYDALGRAIQITDPVDETTTIQYSANHSRTVIDPETHITTYVYNDLPGSPTRLTDAQGHIADYLYDAVGRLTRVEYNDSARIHSYVYDPLDNMTSETHPETGTIGYDFDSANLLWRKTWGGTQTLYYYNASGLRVSFSGAETVTYGYNEKGAVASVTGSTGWSRTGITYDDFGHVTAESVSIPYLDPDLDPVNLTYAYDDNGRLTETTYPDGKRSIQSFNGLDRPETLRFGQGETPPELIKEASYGPMKLPSMMNYHDVMSSGTTFYANGAPNTYSLMRGATPLYNATYDYNGVGNITSISSTAPALDATFGYDSLNRLTSAGFSTGNPGTPLTYEYVYDPYGNMLIAGAFSKTYDGSNRIFGYQYDSRGNLLAGEPGASYEWDTQNRLQVIRDATGQCVADYRYDDRGRRIASFPPLPDINVAGYPYGSNADFTSSLQSPAYRTFTITNQGLGSLNIGALLREGTDKDMFTVTQAPTTPVLPGQATQFTIQFLPASTGDKTATLSIASDDLDENPYVIELRGFCEPEMEIGNCGNGGTYDFGTITVGQSSADSFYLENIGTATLVLYEGWPAAIEEPGTEQNFHIEACVGDDYIPVNEQSPYTYFTVRFAPVSEGPKMATVTIASNDLDENPYSITLVGTGLLGPDKIIEEDELTLLSPNGGEKLEARSLRPITWTGGKSVRDVKLEYSTDNGTTYRPIVERLANVGTYPWQVPEELSGSCLVRISDADGTPTSPIIVSFEFNFRVSLAGEDPLDRPHFVLRAGLPDPRTQTFLVAEAAFAPDGVRGAENLLFIHALGEVQELERFLGRWHRARITYDLGVYTGSVWIDSQPILIGVPLRTDLDVQRPAEISLEPGQDVPVKLWIDDIDVRFVDQSQMGRDPGGIVFRPLFRDNFDKYKSALFPKEGGWLPGLQDTRSGERRQGEAGEEGAHMLRAAGTEQKTSVSRVDDQAYISSARSFKLEASDEDQGTVTKRFSLPEKIPYYVSANNFSIIMSGGEIQAERAGRSISETDIRKERRRRDVEDERTPGSGRSRTGDRRRPLRPTPASGSAGSAASKDPGDVRMLAGPPVSGTFYIHSFDGRLLAEYNLLGQLVRDYVYFGGRLVAEYRNDALYCYLSDQVGSTRIVTDYAGNVVYSAAHDPYGGIQKTWIGDFDPELKFSGKPRDAESELDFFGPRHYDRSQFRLLSPNPVSAGSGFEPASHAWNAYSYPANHPWAETYVTAGWMVSATNIEAPVLYRPLKPEPEIPWWTVSYPWVSRAEDSLWVLVKSSGEKRGKSAIGIEPGWYSLRKKVDDELNAWNKWRKTRKPEELETFVTARDDERYEMWKYITKYEHGSDPVMDAYLADYGMSTDPDNPLSFWNPCYVMFHLYYDF